MDFAGISTVCLKGESGFAAEIAWKYQFQVSVFGTSLITMRGQAEKKRSKKEDDHIESLPIS